MRDTFALRCEPLRRESSGASALKSGLSKRSTRQSKSECGLVNDRNVCSQERDKGRRHRSPAAAGTVRRARAHCRPQNGEAQLALLGLHDEQQRLERIDLHQNRVALRQQ
jgi:hypothetical protein